MKKHWVVYCKQRSGSTPVLQALAYYLERTRSVRKLGEYFNLAYREPLWRDDDLVWLDEQKSSDERFLHTQIPGLPQSLLTRRVDLLARSRGASCFKLFSRTQFKAIDDYLDQTAEFVVLTRRDRFAEYLSLLISLETEKWYEAGGLQIPPGSITAHRAHAATFFAADKAFERRRAALKGAPELAFEDFLAESPAKFLARAGLTEPLDWSEFSFTPRQNPVKAEAKLALFNNAAQVERWYEELPGDL